MDTKKHQVNNYVPGDELYFFGFSRGAYTARATAGLVASVGLCTMPMLDVFYKMYDAYRLREQGQKLEDTAWGKSSDGAEWRSKSRQEVTIKVVGVFDTVWKNHEVKNATKTSTRSAH